MTSVVRSSNSTMQICIEMPPKIRSEGMWNSTFIEQTSYPLTKIQLELSEMFFVTQAAHFLLKSFGIPAVVSQMIAGIIIGPQIMGRIPKYYDFMYPYVDQGILETISWFGYTLFLFLNGVKTDVSILKKVGKKAMYIGVSAMLVPFLFGLIAAELLSNHFALNDKEILNLFYVLTIQSLSAFPVVATLLSDLKILNTNLGRLGSSSALVCDFLGFCLQIISILGYVSLKLHSLVSALKYGGLVCVHILVVVFVLRPSMLWVVKRTPQGRPVKNKYVIGILAVGLGSGLLSHSYHMTAIFGPFLLGLAVPEGPPLGSALVQKLDFFVTKMLIPVLVTKCVMSANLLQINFASNLSKCSVIVIFAAIVGKFVSILIPSLCWKMPASDAFTLALIMSSKGVVDLVLYNVARDTAGADEAMYAIGVLSVVVTATIVPLLVKKLYHRTSRFTGNEPRNILNAKPNSELGILACIHHREDIPALIRLLDFACATRQNPLAIYVLHLIELVGRATPVFISHEMGAEKTRCSYSENVLLSFANFERDNGEAVAVNVFTAISPSKLMQEDICTLAFEKSTSLVVLPFHRKWSIEGLFQSEDATIRALNCRVLDEAPCSVGILVSRWLPGSSSANFNVGVVFFGGPDDREALALAKRMARDPRLKLTVIHFAPPAVEDKDDDWEKMLDLEAFKLMRKESVEVTFLVEMVSDGPDTTKRLRRVADEYDLLLAGRSQNQQSAQTSGLDQWCEFPELGVVGDMLASADFCTRPSVLIVQQQRMLTQSDSSNRNS